MSDHAEVEQPRDEPRILVDHGEHWLLNMGDLAMLDVTIRRLRARWPRARIGVLTDTPRLLRAYFPGVDAIEPGGTSAWAPAGPLAWSSEFLGPRVVGPYDVTRLVAGARLRREVRRALRRARRLARWAPGLLRGRASGPGRNLPDRAVAARSSARTLTPNTEAAVASSSLVVALGGGYLTDVDPAQSTRVLDVLDHASGHGIPTAMLGQGIGPIDDPALLSRAAEVLPRVDVIALRESRSGPMLLARAGVASSRVVVTGGDAVELAHSRRPEALGQDLGVCLRVAGYAPVSAEARGAVATGLRSVAQDLGTDLVPVIISEFRSEDRRSTLPLLEGCERVRRPLARFARPQDVVAQVGRCRVVVTGAYHAGVFALSQGIPVVALTSSPYYDDKFLGLAGMFGSGLELIRLDGDELGERLAAAVHSAWTRAPEGRATLLASAAEQIAASRTTFEQICALV